VGQETADGITVGDRLIAGIPVVAVTFGFTQHGGTLSTGNVPHLVAAADRAARRRVPLVSFVASA
jgi:acetyl-CoA carboxylase beta subunit